MTTESGIGRVLSISLSILLMPITVPLVLCLYGIAWVHHILKDC